MIFSPPETPNIHFLFIFDRLAFILRFYDNFNFIFNLLLLSQVFPLYHVPHYHISYQIHQLIYSVYCITPYCTVQCILYNVII
jgi:hypothetical protein